MWVLVHRQCLTTPSTQIRNWTAGIARQRERPCGESMDSGGATPSAFSIFTTVAGRCIVSLSSLLVLLSLSLLWSGWELVVYGGLLGMSRRRVHSHAQISPSVWRELREGGVVGRGGDGGEEMLCTG
ncbi:hypothetical protein K505DRAFT_26250 [Melanomma pulvis-pyrius CBS 109.77]|uniref:Copper transporter n=1 Tax=Melanomma pulvis-pyrius CBS 109.77 TaxID=1314802 RepID=A0A6A6XFH0_9PLEO|nr:hypothetical protein K505DRAFT_26250 [Melanomma pulvis-pyrius CBS 109.77]